ncbi:hypothetical protein HPB50_001420 [Hyalomma asiaticum]|uniref:Uncharacterized protein n=1 Tax=Hyalomma asiaticum TaxID=266040 RepID=A0ACB7TF87_HYAAI|nr:hypothetical protein HPB50_001420 [Hyalomma asiaticum]
MSVCHRSAGFLVGVLSRALCGEPVLLLPALIHLPLYDAERGQQFPFRTMCMLLSLCSLILGSAIAKSLFQAGILPDVWRSFVSPEQRQREEGPTAAAATSPPMDPTVPPAAETSVAQPADAGAVSSNVASPPSSAMSPPSDALSRRITPSAPAEGIAEQKQLSAVLQSMVASPPTAEGPASNSATANQGIHRKSKGQKSKKKRK